MQIKYGFKKEWLQFTRTKRLLGVILATVSFAVADPLMLWGTAKLLDMVQSSSDEITEAVAASGMMSIISSNGSLMFANTMTDLTGTALLIVALILMSTAGGERKRRETIVPTCAGLRESSYLIPKYVLYPGALFVFGLISGLIAGAICSALSGESVPDVFTRSLCGALYLAFYTAVYFSIGLSSARPALAAILMYVGTMIVQMIMSGLQLDGYNPFTLKTYAVNGAVADEPMFSAGSMVTAVILAIIIAGLMYVLNLVILKSKRVNNQEDKPEF